MSYNQNYGQPQANMQQASQLPYPTYSLLMAPMNVQRGQPPFLPNVQYMPPPLQQYFPLIVTDCIDAIQSKAQANPLRTFMFNQMSMNSFNNLEFTAFVEGVIRMVDMKMAKREFTDVQQASFTCANFFAELNTAGNVIKYPELMGCLDQNAVQGVRAVLQNLNQVMQEMNAYFAGTQQRPAPFQQGGYPQPGGFQQPQAFQQPQQGGWQQPQQHVSSANWRDARGSVQAGHMSSAPMAATPFSGGGSGYSSGGSMMPSDPVAARYEAANRDRPAPAMTTSVHVQNIHDVRRERAEQMINNVPTMQSDRISPVQATEVKAIETDVKWSPSEAYPINIAYNPNTEDLYYRVEADDKVKPLIKPKEQSEMDMAAHLTVPSFVSVPPVGVHKLDTSVRVFETEKSLAEDAANIQTIAPVQQLNVAYRDKSFYSELSLTESWLRNNIQLALMKKKDQKTNLYRTCSVLLDPLVSTKSPKAMINDIASSVTLEAACNKMQRIAVQIEEGTYLHGDAKSLTFVNNRLTHAFNEFMKKKLAVPNGWVDSFMEDALHVISFINNKYGKAFATALVEKQSDIIAQALAYVEKEYEDEQNSNLFPDEDSAKILESVDVTYFIDYVSFTSLDLFSTELKIEIPETEVSVGIFEKQTPLLRQVAENILTHERALQVNFSRHLVQTADGVTLEITQSVINPDFYLVCDAAL